MATAAFPGERPDRLEEACAVFGVYAPGEDVARLTCFGLQALQHRGQESAGIAVGDGDTVLIHKDLGLVDQVFTEETLAHLQGDIAIGHTRYSTAGGGGWTAAQPHVSAIDDELIALAHNVNPGEIVKISAAGLESEQGAPAGRRASCIFEYVYFARPDSVLDGDVVYHARRRMGRILVREAPVEADYVLGVPDSGVPPALGYAAESCIEYCDGIVKNRYVGRTFTQPTQEMRQMGIRIKLNPLLSIIRGKRLVVIDDSIVRGNTSKKLVEMLRQAGAAEVHLRIVSPEVMWPCFYGIDTDTQDQLISANMAHDEVCAHIGCDSLAFISLAGLHEAVHADHDDFCDACFSGDYPVEIPEPLRRKSFLANKDASTRTVQVGTG